VLVQRFQEDPRLRVALLSLTAAGVALTLTAARRAVFAELFWTPAALLQAEDRCHRIGQRKEVEIEYIMARGSLDDCLWPLIRHKMRLLGEMVEGDEKVRAGLGRGGVYCRVFSTTGRRTGGLIA
jgi:SWI/SNF-related matrix-associated actin-dependent regulator of chromatin subfamily A-like protein 1